VGENLWSRDSPQLPRDPLQQKLEVAAVDPVALHDEADQGSSISSVSEHCAMPMLMTSLSHGTTDLPRVGIRHLRRFHTHSGCETGFRTTAWLPE
jgi:hypothetical protein